jgi:hypothetical protein
MVVMEPSWLENVCDTKLSDETKIFEGMAVVAKDGSVGQSTGSLVGKPCSLRSKQTYLVADSSSNRVNQDNVKFQSCNMKKSSEIPCGLRGSQASLQCGGENFVVNSCTSFQHSDFPPIWHGTSSSGKNNSLVDDSEELWLDFVSEETSPDSTEHTQNMFRGRDRQNRKERAADYQSDIRASQVQLALRTRRPFSRKKNESKKLSKDRQGEIKLTSRLHKHVDISVIDSAQDNQCNSPAFSRPRDVEEFAVLNPRKVCGAAAPTGCESHKFQQPQYFKSSVILDAESRKHDDRINSNQKSKEFYVPESGCAHGRTVEETWEHTGQIVGPDGWHLGKYSKNKSYSRKYGSNIGTGGCWHPSKNMQQLEPQNVTQTYVGSAPVSFILLTQAEAQLTSLKGDFFKAASSGSPLHGTLTALLRLATQSDSPECGLMSAGEVSRTVALLEQTVSFFLRLLAAKSMSTSGTLLFTFGLPNHLFLC